MTATRGKYFRFPLVQALHVRHKRRLMEELAKRFPEDICRYTKPSTWRIMLPSLVMPIIACGLILAYSSHLLNKYPEVRITPQAKTWRITQDQVNPQEYSLDGLSLFIPHDFEPVRVEKSWLRLLLRNEEKNGELRVWSHDGGLRSPPVRYGLGIKDWHEFDKAVYYSRIGLVWIMLKVFGLRGLDRTEISDVRQSGTKGFVIQGTRNTQYLVKARLLHGEGNRALSMRFSGSQPLDERTLGAIIGSVRAASEANLPVTKP